MKVQVNGQDLFELTEIQKKVIQNEIAEKDFDADMKRRLEWILKHKYERSFERLKQQWDPILSKRLSSIPTDPDQYANLVFSQQDYKNRSVRDAEQMAGDAISL